MRSVTLHDEHLNLIEARRSACHAPVLRDSCRAFAPSNKTQFPPMIHIHSEGTEFDYVPAASAASALESEWGRRQPNGLSLATGHDTRLAYFRDMIDPSRQNPYWLVWQSTPNLVELDRNVERGEVAEGDFSGWFRTGMYKLFCSSYGSKFWTLAIDPGDPFLNAPQLHRKKFLALSIVPCPQCGGSFRQMVAKVLWREEVQMKL